MNIQQLLIASLMVLFPYALSSEVNGELRMSIVRWAENKGKDVNRVVRQLDNSAIHLEPNEPYAVHRKNSPLTSRDWTSEIIYRENITEPGTYSLNFTKYLSTTWTWSREHNMDYVLNVSRPVSIKVPDDSLVHVDSLKKDFWEFKTPLPWHEAEATCRAAGLKLAQPKTRNEVEELQKVLHLKIHNRESGCHNETWTKKNGYCFFLAGGFNNKKGADTFCKSMGSMLPFPSLGDVTAWQEAVVNSSSIIIGGRKKGTTTHAGAHKQLDGQWLWGDGSTVQKEAWTPGKPTGNGDCSVLYPSSGKLIDKGCWNTWQTLCQAPSSNHWLGALGSDDKKCVEWVNGECIEDEDHETESHIEDLWQTGKPGDLTSSNYALLLQIENDKPLTIMKNTERRPFLCEPACPLGFVNFGPHCLLVEKVWQTWHEAQSSCKEMGLQLYETEEKTLLKDFLPSRGFIETYWIGGIERSFTGKDVDMTDIKKLQYICELAHGTRKMNVTNQLSYTDQEEEFMLPKVVTPSSHCIVEVKEKTIRKTYPFSVQMNITGWIWVEYDSPTDEHGSFQCDNNNDWVGGEQCYAHSKWGYSTSYLQDGDQIMSQDDDSKLILNGTVTYTYNEYEVSVPQCKDDNGRRVRESRSVRGRRTKRSTPSTEINSKNLKAKANSLESNDNNKPLMSYIGKRAGEWVRAQAQERKAHLVAYTIDQLSPTVTDMKLEKEMSELLTPGSIFEEEFENTGTESVITTFSKRKSVSNSYRWSVSKGLSIEDSHIASYSMTNTQSASNTFSLSNNIAQSESTGTTINQETANEMSSKRGTSKNEGITSTKEDRIDSAQSTSTGEEHSARSSNTETVSEGESASKSTSVGSSTTGSKTSEVIDTSSSSTSDTNTISKGSRLSSSEGSSSSTSGSAGANFLFVSAKVSFSSNTQSSEESHKTTETKKSKINTIGQQRSESSSETLGHETNQNVQDTSTQTKTGTTSVGNEVGKTQSTDNTLSSSQGTSIGSSAKTEISENNEISQGKTSTYGMKNSVNQGRSKSYESAVGSDASTGTQLSQEAQKSRIQQVNIDRNEEIESSEAEELHTENEVTIPPGTNVKIEWRVEQRKVRLPWKASIHMTGWINVRFKKSDDEVCDIYLDSNKNIYTNTSWTYDYTSPCEKDNRLYGYPLSYLKDKNFIQQGDGLRFVASGIFEAVVATSHYLRVTETPVDSGYEDDNKSSGYEDDNKSDYNDYYDDQPLASRRKRELRRLPKVTDYRVEFDGNGRANIGKNNRHFRRFHATKTFKGIY